ncbi:MAG: hypothetical protein IH831_01640 [Planctomycetes bacterium]|nr:hypothetical protein [Planctomycetota bacterium]
MNIRKLRWWFSVQASLIAACSVVAASASLTGFVQAQSAGEMKPLAVVALSGYDALVEDINFAGSMAGKPQLGGMLEGMIMMFTQGQGLVGFDKTKPVGVVIQSNGADIGGAVCVPVTDLKKLLTLLQQFGLTTEDVGDGITKVVAPDQTLFIREANGWAFVSREQQMLDGLPDDPEKLLSEITKEYDFGARVHVQNIPEPYRQMAVMQLEMGMQAGLKKLPNESDEQFAARKEMTAAQLEQLKQLINDIDELTIGLALDGSEQRAYLDFAYTAVAGSKLAEQIAMYNDAKTNFAGFFQPDAAMMMSFASKMHEADIAQMDQMFGALRKQMKAAVEQEADLPSDEAREVVLSALDDFLDAVQSTFQAGMMDGGMVLNLAPNSVTFVAGGFIGEPAKVESGLKKIAEVVKEEKDFPGIQWNAENHADVSFHTLSLPIPEHEEESRQMFGETIDLAVGIGKQSVYFAFGRNCLEAAISVIDASLAEPQKSVPPMEMTISLKQIMETAAAFADESEKPMLQSIAAMLGNEAVGRDHVRIVTQTIPNGIRTRIEAEEGVLRAIGMAAMQAQMEAARAGQGF